MTNDLHGSGSMPHETTHAYATGHGVYILRPRTGLRAESLAAATRQQSEYPSEAEEGSELTSDIASDSGGGEGHDDVRSILSRSEHAEV